MTQTLVFAVAGIPFAVTAAPEIPCDDLHTRYAAFLTDLPARWHLHLRQSDVLPGPEYDHVVNEEWITRFRVQRIAGVIDLAARQAEVLVLSPRAAASAIDRTVSYILMQILPREHDALMLHGVAIVRNGWGLAHSGRSGVGKTTTARLAAGYAEVLVDENLVVSAAGPQPTLFSTPFWGASTPLEMIHRVNRQAPLRALLLPEHGPDFVLEPLSLSDAILGLLTTEKVATERVSSASAWMDAAEKLVTRVPTYRLYFRPTVELWPFLDDALGL